MKEVTILKKKSESKPKALKIVEIILEKKAKKPIILDVQKIANFCDYFVICSAQSSAQVEAIYDWVLAKSEENNLMVHHRQLDEQCQWLLIDFFDVILHIFLDEKRAFYNLEHLWSDAKRVRIPRKTRSGYTRN